MKNLFIRITLVIFAFAFLVPNTNFETKKAQASDGKVIDISINDQMMTIVENNRVINKFAVSTGTWDMPTPLGTFYIQNHIYDAYSQPYDLYMPYWMGLGGGYGIHGLPYWKYSWGRVYEGVNHLGWRVSHGCIRVAVVNAEWLYSWAGNGTKVVIHQESGPIVPITPPDYDGVIVDQSSKDITLRPGESTELWVKMKNTGKHWWYDVGNNPIRLGTFTEQDRTSVFESNSWISSNRVTKIDHTSIEYGQETTFKFTITAPQHQMLYTEHFKPLAEGHSWFADPNLDISWNINVYQADYSSEWYSQSDWPIVTEGDTKTLAIKYKNTGTNTWYNNGSNPIRLATNGPIDRSSVFYNPGTWLSSNRATNMDESEVKPGEIATFTFTIKAPTTVGEFDEHFRLVAEGKKWMEDEGVFIKINVVQDPNNINTFSLEDDLTKSS